MSTAVLVKKELMLGGLTCAHCAEVIGDTVKNIDGVQASNINFISKKLTLQIDACKNEEDIIDEVINLINSIEPGLDIEVINKITKESNKRELILGGLSCAHCAEVINDKVSLLDGIKKSNLNFVNKKLSIEIDSDNENIVIENVIDVINDVEPGLDIELINDKKINKSNKKELTLGGLNCAHCAEVINEKVALLDGIKSANLNFINKKLSIEIESYNEDDVIKNVIDTINNIEQGLEISISSKEDKKQNSQGNKISNPKEDNSKKESIKIIIGALVFIFAFVEEAMGVNSK